MLDKVPAKVVLTIAQYLESTDQSSLRWVCRTTLQNTLNAYWGTLTIYTTACSKLWAALCNQNGSLTALQYTKRLYLHLLDPKGLESGLKSLMDNLTNLQHLNLHVGLSSTPNIEKLLHQFITTLARRCTGSNLKLDIGIDVPLRKASPIFKMPLSSLSLRYRGIPPLPPWSRLTCLTLDTGFDIGIDTKLKAINAKLGAISNLTLRGFNIGVEGYQEVKAAHLTVDNCSIYPLLGNDIISVVSLTLSDTTVECDLDVVFLKSDTASLAFATTAVKTMELKLDMFMPQPWKQATALIKQTPDLEELVVTSCYLYPDTNSEKKFHQYINKNLKKLHQYNHIRWNS